VGRPVAPAVYPNEGEEPSLDGGRQSTGRVAIPPGSFRSVKRFVGVRDYGGAIQFGGP